ncbi:hypothetical protein FJQ98_01420 [Lysinibacillus agricola]|uniref:Uncharacterized protein n=1 Tax=Lysinibacillus agricola TaxID=2590012 RepID=A0ABX7AV58_9BACI|nr:MULTISPECIES: hypothetical protein [Lysinibacillus]QQP12783.1 hypothetical protein FJQ98_01420 [Lysinibacillus agricola]
MHYAFAQNTFVAPTPPGSSALCESETTATMFYLCESEATATTKRPAGTEINPTLW